MVLPDADLQRAIYAALKGSAALEGLVDGRIFDHVPDPIVYPYVRIGEGQTLDDEAEGIDGAECFVQVSAFSGQPGKMQAKDMAKAIVAALKAELAIDGHRQAEMTFDGVQYLKEQRNAVTHAVLTFRYLTEPTG